MIILRTPKGWTGPKEVDGQKTENSWRSHQVPLSEMATKPDHLGLLEKWMKSLTGPKNFSSISRRAGMIGFGGHLRQRNLVRAPRILRLLAVGGGCPALGRSQNDHRPPRGPSHTASCGFVLNGFNLSDDGIQGFRHKLVRGLGFCSLLQNRLCTHSLQTSFPAPHG